MGGYVVHGTVCKVDVRGWWIRPLSTSGDNVLKVSLTAADSLYGWVNDRS